MKHNSTCLHCKLSALCVIGRVSYKVDGGAVVLGLSWSKSLLDDVRAVAPECAMPTLTEWLHQQQLVSNGRWAKAVTRDFDVTK
jgi:hypothetical protein